MLLPLHALSCSFLGLEDKVRRYEICKLFQKNNQKRSPFLGTVDKKTLHKNLEFTATEQYKLIRANLDFMLHEDEKCPVIGVTSAMRGEGKSTTATGPMIDMLPERAARIVEARRLSAETETTAPKSSPPTHANARIVGFSLQSKKEKVRQKILSIRSILPL